VDRDVLGLRDEAAARASNSAHEWSSVL